MSKARSNTQRTTRLNVSLSQDKHKKFKTFAAVKNISLTELTIEAIEEKIIREISKKANRETLKAFKDSEEDKVFKVDDLEEFFRELNIE